MVENNCQNDLSGVSYNISIIAVQLVNNDLPQKHILFKISFSDINEPLFSKTYYGEKYVSLNTIINENIFNCDELKKYYESSNLEIQTIEGTF